MMTKDGQDVYMGEYVPLKKEHRKEIEPPTMEVYETFEYTIQFREDRRIKSCDECNMIDDINSRCIIDWDDKIVCTHTRRPHNCPLIENKVLKSRKSSEI
jgi:hypothetical protein